MTGWGAQTPILNVKIDFGSSNYTIGGSGEAGRNILIDTYGWIINDGGGI